MQYRVGLVPDLGRPAETDAEKQRHFGLWGFTRMKKQILLGMLIAATLLGLVGVAAAVGDQGSTAAPRHTADLMDCTHGCG